MRFCYYLSPGAPRSDAFKGCNDAAKAHSDKQELSSADSYPPSTLSLFAVVI